MVMKRKRTPGNRLEEVLAQARRDRDKRSDGYRDRALKIFPHVCGRCGRDFSGPNLRELTVHHKDHNHDNNPSDGSNWELLCMYCHDMEHARYLEDEGRADDSLGDDRESSSTFRPFADLKDLLQGKKK
jgi:5-methylcytosine-specific restriction endonuclease McrA